ncbi:TrlF family AAA-like ATPase [Traorella massiliensis]|mgnify:CR=1 FL=1|uniref:TrlF family AAA-like ATPase n=1 Tax=Traorella massiliensis TaxID=1903263 RepID=UPI00248E9D52|nr:hypothetical protein [Traorella massiliensis]
MDNGSNWIKWDLHVHTASSYDYKYKGEDADQLLVEALIKNEIRAVVLTDHFLIDKSRIDNIRKIVSEKGSDIKVFPGVELRTDKGHPNIHVILIFDEQSDLKILCEDFDAIMLRDKAKNPNNPQLTYWEYSDIVEFSKNHNAIISVHTGRKANGLDKQIKTDALSHADAIKEEYAKTAHIFEVANLKDVNDYKRIVFKDIKERPVIICSDNHDPRNYETKEYLWIKSKPTFEGLKQAIIHPSERIYVGDEPPKLINLRMNPEKYIDNVEVHRKENHTNSDDWFDFDMSINSGLTTIIGNKGSGKSALADIIGYIGKSSNISLFSFLNKQRFCKEDKKYNLDYEGKIIWKDREESYAYNFDLDSYDGIATVRYLPQRYIEETCNNLDSRFQSEIDKVIFSYVEEKDRSTTTNLNELISLKEAQHKNKVDQLKIQISDVNKIIIGLEKKKTKKYKADLEKNIAHYQKELERLEKSKPKEVQKPKNDDDKNSKGLNAVEKYENTIIKLDVEIEQKKDEYLKLSEELNELESLNTELNEINDSIKEFNSKAQTISLKYGIDPPVALECIVKNDELVRRILTLKKTMSILAEVLSVEFERKAYNENTPIETIKDHYSKSKSLYCKKYILEQCIERQKKLLSKPQQDYQNYLKRIQEWQNKKTQIEGSKTSVNTLNYYVKELEYVEKKLPSDLENAQKLRFDYINSLFDILERKKEILDEIYIPVERKLSSVLENIDDKVVFKSTVQVDSNLSHDILLYINQTIQSKFKGKAAGLEYVESLLRKYNFNQREDVIKFINEVLDAINEDEQKIETLLKRDQLDFYNFITELDYLDVGFSLKMGDKELSQLSPGEKGTVLLIFYLALDKEELPLIIDQPEDNLDNQSVFNKLVPSVLEAKQHRQVILITHNPNLAIACDSELVICCEKNTVENKINYLSGAIEDPIIKQRIVDILEGTMPAFNLRTEKYKELIFGNLEP